MANRQPGEALPYFIRLRRPNVFDLIRDHNLFTAVQDQALLLVEFDQELVKKRKEAGRDVQGRSPAIALLVDHTHSIPVSRAFFALNICVSLQLTIDNDVTAIYCDTLGRTSDSTVTRTSVLLVPLPRRVVRSRSASSIRLR